MSDMQQVGNESSLQQNELSAKTSPSAVLASTAGPASLSGWMGLVPHSIQSPVAVGLSKGSPGCAGL